MDLVACAAPCGRLEPAPDTGLRRNSEAERWEGFWMDDSYYVRCTPAAGEVRWYRQGDEHDDTPAGTVPTAPLMVEPRACGAARATARTRGILVRVYGGRGSLALVGVRRRRAP